MRLIKRPEVESRTGLRKSSIYQKIETGEFPLPVKLSNKSVAWVEAEVEAWIAMKVAARDAKAAAKAVRP